MRKTPGRKPRTDRQRWLRAELRRVDMTQVELAAELDCDVATLGRWLGRDADAEPDTREAAASRARWGEPRVSTAKILAALSARNG